MSKHVALKEWRNALFMSFTINKIAIPYNRTMLLKTAFGSLKKITTQDRKAREFCRRARILKVMQALTKYQMDEVKVRSLQEKMLQKKLEQVFDGFIDQCLIKQDLRLKGEELKERTEGLMRESSYRHWFTLCQDKLRL